MSGQRASLRFAAEHPVGPGHFPGNPVIPGALLLDEVIVAIGGVRRDAPMRIRSAKFQAVVRPGDQLELRWEDLPEGQVGFECCREDGVPALSGRLQFEVPP